MSERVNGVLLVSSLQLSSEHMGLPPNLKLLLSWPSKGLEFLEEVRGLPGHSCMISMEGLSAGKLRRRQCSSVSESMIPCGSGAPASLVRKSSIAVVEGSWTSAARVGTGGMSTACSGKVCFKSILVGVLKAFSSCSTKLWWSEAPDLFSMRISPVKLKNSLVSSSEVMSELPKLQSGWRTCARKTGIGSVGGITVSVRAGGMKGSSEVF